MILINQEVKLLQATEEAEKLIEHSGRICTRTTAATLPEVRNAFIKSLIKKGHESVIEHAMLTFELTTNRGIMSEITRHRLASFSIQSTRYVKFDKDIVCIRPIWLKFFTEGVYNEVITPDVCHSQSVEFHAERIFISSLVEVEKRYHQLLAHGWRAEQAREVLQNALATIIVVTANVREWRHIFRLRTSKKAHPQFRPLMRDALKLAKEKMPVFFEDIIPDEEKE